MGSWKYAVFLALSFLCVVGAALSCFFKHQRECKNTKDEYDKKHKIFTRFQLFLLFFLIGVGLLLAPACYDSFSKNEVVAVKIFKTLFLAVYNAAKVLVLDGEFSYVQDAVTQSGLCAAGEAVYTIYGSFLFVLGPIFTSIFVLSFFKNLASYWKYKCSGAKMLCYFSELNEKSIELANSIRSTEGKRALICFFDVFERNEEEDFELIGRAQRMGCICFKRDITQIELKRGERVRKFYFIGKDEDENVKQALSLIERCRADTKWYNSNKTQFYVFSTAADSEVLFDSVDMGNMKVRRVNGIRNLAINTLLNEPVFEHYIEQEGRKKISVLIVGAGTYGTELAKALTWCGQIPNFDVSIHILDQKKDLESKFNALAPELMSKNKERKEGEPHYEIVFHPGVDVARTDFSKLLGAMENITTAFVTLGNDALNVDVAMKLRRDCARLKIKQGYATPRIYSVVYSTMKNKTLHKNSNLTGADGIKFIGSIGERYSLANIEQIALEEVGAQLHHFWWNCQEGSRASYEQYEYNRRASVAAAVHVVVLDLLKVHFSDDDERKRIEHERWSAYMRAEGQIYSPQKSAVAKTHYDLRSYCDLSDATKENDGIVQKIVGTKELDVLLEQVRARRQNS